MRLTTTPGANGPARDIPAHRLAPWGSLSAVSLNGSGGEVQDPWSDRHLRAGGRGFSRSKSLTPSRAERRMIPV
ncbi:hypothetical protein [Nitrobacter sp. TKz-YC02]|uniref:hypothetical protein n=1 Tax=Nitrobacter sp. TKz-YC02 TaxID=3398704 RepID=UPI003CE756AD